MSFEVEYFTLQAADATARKVYMISGVPVDTSAVALDLIGGSAQAYGADYAVTDSTVIRWDSSTYGLYNFLGTTDKLRVIYDRS